MTKSATDSGTAVNRKTVRADGSPLTIRFFGLNESFQKNSRTIITGFLRRRKCEALLVPVFTCLHELAANAIKANYKHIFFGNFCGIREQSNAINLDYTRLLRVFSLEMSRDNAAYFEQLARRQKLSATVSFRMDADMFVIRVCNPVPLTVTEKERIRQKLSDARECSDIAHYFMRVENDPTREGAGVGLVLVSMMLRSMGVTHHALRIGSTPEQNTAEIRIPLIQQTLAVFNSNTNS
jgi:hypothetical protein